MDESRTINKILVADANFCAVPIVKILQVQGIHTTVTGALLSDPCHDLADVSIAVDYSDQEALLEAVREHGFQGIVSGCNDCSYVSAAYVANKLGLPGYDDDQTVVTLLHKDRFRAFAASKRYPIPQFSEHREGARNLTFPILIKPVDAFSGRGVQKLDTEAELDAAWSEARQFSASGKVVAEEFVEGSLHSHSAFIKQGKLIASFFVDEYCTVYPYQVNSSCLSVRLSDSIKSNVELWCEQMAKDLNLTDGLVHTQFIADENDFVIIEVTRRCPGDLYSDLITQSTGVDYISLYSAPFCGQQLPDIVTPKFNKFVARHTASESDELTFHSVYLNLPCGYRDTYFVPLLRTGAQMKPAPFGKSGIYFIEFKSREEMKQITPNLKNYICHRSS